MGGIESKLMIEEYSPVIQYSKEHNISEWDKFKPKTIGYYTRKATVIPPEYYPHTKGYFWGTYPK